MSKLNNKKIIFEKDIHFQKYYIVVCLTDFNNKRHDSEQHFSMD